MRRIQLRLSFRWLFVTAVVLYPSLASSQQLIDQVQYAVPLEVQNTAVWCWVAAAKMEVEALGAQAPPQCAMLQQVYGAPCCTQPGVCARPGSAAEVQNLIAKFGFTATSINTWGDGWSFFRLLQNSGAPLVVWVDRSHYIVVTGMRVVQMPYGPLGIVSINDPLRGSGEQAWPDFTPRIGAVISVQR